jgi:hypothetical protein
LSDGVGRRHCDYRSLSPAYIDLIVYLNDYGYLNEYRS